MDPWTIALIVGTLVTAGSQVYQGQMAAAAYEAQAQAEGLKFKKMKNDEKEKGVQVLESLNETLQSIIAQSAASGVVTQEGASLLQQTVSIRRGVEDYNAASLNALIQQKLGLVQIGQLNQAAKDAGKGGYVKAAATIGQSVASYGLLKGPPSGSATEVQVITKTKRVSGPLSQSHNTGTPSFMRNAQYGRSRGVL